MERKKKKRRSGERIDGRERGGNDWKEKSRNRESGMTEQRRYGREKRMTGERNRIGEGMKGERRNDLEMGKDGREGNDWGEKRREKEREWLKREETGERVE